MNPNKSEAKPASKPLNNKTDKNTEAQAAPVLTAPTPRADADIRVTRHFTTEGVHPYDEVEWELRTAKVGSGDKTVFEQHGVEVPAFWSQNATNIVAQKYFAYNLDDPRRETSVKQLIDRVVLTIAAQGEKNGYFTNSERETFEAELTYILLHQKAAFNSPVWFNVGIMERPATSACFILHIEDSLKSIGRWQMEETEIFRNGSGAGINLSNLRGAEEQLSRGGVSSGPVTFMRAADANAGTIASGGRCIPGDQQVIARQAGKQMKLASVADLAKASSDDISFEVLSYSPDSKLFEFKPAYAWKQPFQKGVVKLVLQWENAERDFFMSKDHPVRAFKGNYIKAGDLKPGQPVMAYTNFEEEGHPSSVKDSVPYESIQTARVVSVGKPAREDVFDIEVSCATDDDKTSKSGHNFVLVPMETNNEGIRKPKLGSFEQDVKNFGVVVSNTRRAAKMIMLDADHPDIFDFIWCKAREEDRIRALSAAGFDMSLGSDVGEKNLAEATAYQNANNSVRITQELLDAAESDGDWNLIRRTDGKVSRTVKAREILEAIAEASWKCADPGVQYDTTINDWHTTPELGKINGSNPCFPAGSRVHTSKGLVPIEQLYRRLGDGEAIKIYTHNATGYDAEESLGLDVPFAIAEDVEKDIVRLTFTSGAELRCTPDHRIWTLNRGWVAAEDLDDNDMIKISNLPTSTTDGISKLPVAINGIDSWTEEVAEVLGHLIADGCVTDQQTILVYSADDVADGLFDEHKETMETICGSVSISHQPNGTVQIRSGKLAVREFFLALGASTKKAHEKELPWSIWDAPDNIQKAYLRGYFGADGCVARTENGKASRYVGAASSSASLARDTHKLLTSMGISGRMYVNVHSNRGFEYEKVDGTTVTYASKPCTDIRISGSDIEVFGREIGFSAARKQRVLSELLSSTRRYASKKWTKLRSIEDDGREIVYNLTERINHSYIVDGIVVANCSEFMHVDNSSCNLASLNLLTFLNNDGTFNIEDFKHVARTVFTAQDITICFAHFPTRKIGENSRNLRQIGIGYANLGALLMNLGYAYDSDEGRQVAGAITSLLTGESYLQSTHIAERVGAYHHYPETADSMQRVLRKHFTASKGLDGVFADVATASQESWAASIRRCKKHGIRNCQASVAAPTGCLTGDTLVHTRDGLVRLDALGDVSGEQWQDVDFDVLTDEGWRQATKFFINGVEPVVTIKTSTGRELRSTAKHQIKVRQARSIVAADGLEDLQSFGAKIKENIWKHTCDVSVGDVIPTIDSTRELLVYSAALALSDGDSESTNDFKSDNEVPNTKYETVVSVELTEEEMTYDLSVPSNVTYVANGFVSHNTISFLMDCDTTGIEPDFALIKHKTLAGGGTMSIPNKAVGQALRNLGYAANQIDDIVAYIAEEENGYPRGNVVGAPHLKEEHYSVFDCAVGDRSISAEGHLKMMAAAQPFLSGAISKSVNVPSETTVEEIADIYALGGKLGLKAIAVYRDGCKNFQPLSDANKTKDRPEEAVKAVEERLTSILGDGLLRGERRQLSRDADVRRVKFRVGMISGYIHVGLFDDGRPGDVFINVGQAGSTLRGFIDAWGIAISLALQHGTPLDIIVSKLANQQFEPHGFTDDEHIRNAKSIVDYVVKWMAMEFLPDEAVYAELGINKPLPGTIAEGSKELGAEQQKLSEEAMLAASEALDYSDSPAHPEIRPRVDIHSATVPSVRKIEVKTASDVKLCGSCGSRMVQTGVCYTCPACGENSGGCS